MTTHANMRQSQFIARFGINSCNYFQGTLSHVGRDIVSSYMSSEDTDPNQFNNRK